jgi:hypothetical protein
VTGESHGGAGHRPRHRRGVGELLVATAASVIGTVIAPRPVGSWLTRWVDRIVSGVFRLATRNIPAYKRPDWVLAAQAAAILIAQLAAWVVRLDLGAEVASLLASWLVMPPHRRGPVRSTAARAAGHAMPPVPTPGSPSRYQ